MSKAVGCPIGLSGHLILSFTVCLMEGCFIFKHELLLHFVTKVLTKMLAIPPKCHRLLIFPYRTFLAKTQIIILDSFCE